MTESGLSYDLFDRDSEDELKNYFRGDKAPVCKLIQECLKDKREITILEQDGDINIVYPAIRKPRLYAIAEEPESWQKNWNYKINKDNGYNIIWILDRKDLFDFINFMKKIKFDINIDKKDLKDDRVVDRFDVLDVKGGDT